MTTNAGELWGKIKLAASYITNPEPLDLIEKAINSTGLKENFRLVELCCGHGNLLDALVPKYPKATMVGIDLYDFPEWKKSSACLIKEDIVKYCTSQEGQEAQWDIVLMANTYRNAGWTHAFLTQWIGDHAKFFITDIKRRDQTHLPFPYEEIGEFTTPADTFTVVLCTMTKNTTKSGRELG